MMSAGADIFNFYTVILRKVVHVRWSDIILDSGVSKINDKELNSDTQNSKLAGLPL